VVEVRAVKEDPNKLIQGAKSGYKGDKLSLNFQNIDIRSLLQVFADFTNLNIITSDTVQGSITLRLKDVPWDQALDIVMQAKNLDSRKNGNVVLIAPRDELVAKEKLELERQSQLTALEPVRSEVFQLQYQRAEDIKKMLSEVNGGGSAGGSGQQSQVSRFLSGRGSASADNRTNQLFVTDVPSKLDEIRKLLSKVDIPIRQVIIEARIVEADDRFGRNLGVKFGFNDRKSTIYQTANGINYPVYGAGSNLAGTGIFGTLSGNQQGVIDLSSQSANGSIVGLSGGTSAGNTNFVNLPAAGVGGANPASFALSLFGAGLTKFINLEVSALEAENRGKIISSPRVVTSDSTKATIQSGTEIPYTTTSNSGTTTTFKKAVLKLEVTPQITPEGNVIMDVEVNKDSRGELTPNAGFAIDTKQIKTQVLVENGGTVVIGGVYTQEESNQTSKVPFFGDIPFIGNLFKSSQKLNNRSELLIFLTPRVIVNSALGSNGLGQQ
jgi:type IV pilus assembly protein PilQ